jgi:hypothetical protein
MKTSQQTVYFTIRENRRTMTLTENNITFIQQYYQLVETVEEGFHYVIESFSNFERTEGDRILGDIFSALSMLTNSRVILQEMGISLEMVEVFDSVIEKALLLEDHFHNLEQKQKLIELELFPAFVGWKRKVDQALLPFVQN